ncbi:MAG: hypothetical protein A2Y62_00535 [Candidatus Fischerbacteria bacterium RBG_13_37_8]|uniref:Uncharacterized protein n=1 Tax=Candidatus Fischerbacteria bacterium RBG_13_37_8 TaxID=1817863 RepID=A0A1F5VMG8_9BACT|nr:MAG: hypothetical protein A2Y62_00535 [Candidatus Fischerbacteria bacterium RBG_13_37_8]
MRILRYLIAICSIITISLFLCDHLYSQSLVEAAKKEKERREKIKKDSKVINNEALEEHLKGKGDTPGTITQSGEVSEEETETKTEGKESESKEEEFKGPTDFNGNDEAYWKGKIQLAKQKVSDLEKQVTDLQSQINALQASFYTIDDPNQRQSLNAEINNTQELLNKTKADLEIAKDALAATREEGRRNGALPGWIYD